MQAFDTAPLSTPAGEDFGCIILNSGGGDISDLSRDEIIRLYKIHGALLFRGFDLGGEPGFRSFTEEFSHRFITYPTPTRIKVSEDDTVQTVDRDTNPLQVHSEMSYLPFPLRPEVCWFYCITPSERGGQTTLCDGLRIARAMPERSRAALESQPLKYIMVFPPAIWQRYFHTSSPAHVEAALRSLALDKMFTLAGDEIHLNYVTPALAASKFCREKVFANNLVFNGREPQFPVFADGSTVPGWVYDELAPVVDELTVEVDWRADDLLMFDNTRVLHGRREVLDTDRLIYTRFGAVNF